MVTGGDIIIINITIKFITPFISSEKSTVYQLRIKENLSLLQLENYLEQEQKIFKQNDFAVIKGNLHFEFIVNGVYAPLDQILKEGDMVIILPQIGGG